MTEQSAKNAAPRGIPSRAINERQRDDDLLLLQRAASASNRNGQSLEAVRSTAAVMLAVGGVVVTLIGHGRAAYAVVGLVWFVVSAFLLKSLVSSTARQSALLQEIVRRCIVLPAMASRRGW